MSKNKYKDNGNDNLNKNYQDGVDPIDRVDGQVDLDRDPIHDRDVRVSDNNMKGEQEGVRVTPVDDYKEEKKVVVNEPVREEVYVEEPKKPFPWWLILIPLLLLGLWFALTQMNKPTTPSTTTPDSNGADTSTTSQIDGMNIVAEVDGVSLF